MRRNQRRGMSPVAVGLLAIALTVAVTYLAFTKEIPFRGHYEVDAVVRTANNLKAGSFVRIAGVNVGKVQKVEPIAPGGGTAAARITMRIDEKGRPIHKDATLKIRPRIFFEGNFFVDLQPGTPSAPELGDGETLPINQSAAPVQFDQVLSTLQADTRKDLKTLLDELDRAFSDGGAQAINRTFKHTEPAYRTSAIVSDATLGLEEGDLSGYLRGATKFAEGLDRNPPQLKALITDFRRTAGAFAARDQELSRAIAELPRTLRAGLPALAELNRALPPVRRFVADFRPGVRSSGPALDAQLPFVRQLRGLVQKSELRGLVSDLRPTVPALAALNRTTVPLLREVREASSCQNEVILPWSNDTIEDPDFPAIGPVYQEQTKPLIGLAGESRSFDANGQWFRVQLNGSQFATPMGDERFMLTDRPLVGVNPPRPAQRSPLRPDVPCETQEPPDLRTEQGRPPSGFRVRDADPADLDRARDIAVQWLRGRLEATGRSDDVKVGEKLVTPGEVPAAPVGGGR